MNTNRNVHTLATNHSSGHQPELAPSIMLNGHGACQPPRNSVVASADDRGHVDVLGEHEHRELQRRVLGVEAADQFALGLGQVERRPVGLADHRRHVDHERRQQQEHVPEAVLLRRRSPRSTSCPSTGTPRRSTAPWRSRRRSPARSSAARRAADRSSRMPSPPARFRTRRPTSPPARTAPRRAGRSAAAGCGGRRSTPARPSG